MSSNDLGLARINQLLDEHSFVEIGAKVQARSTDFSMQDQAAPSDGVITGYGTVNEQLVFVYSQDPEVLSGSVGEMHAKKIAALYQKAVQMGAPIVGLLDSTGVRLAEATDALEGLGTVMAAAANASGVIPQISLVFGNCGGGMATLASMADIVGVENDGALFFNAPNTICGNRKDVNDTSSAEFRAAQDGVVDFTGTTAELMAKTRSLIEILPANCEMGTPVTAPADDLNRGVGLGAEAAADKLAELADAGSFVELKSEYAKDMTIGLMSLGGVTVGAVANNDKALTAEGCEKAADFIKFCDAFSIPVLTLTNIDGYASSVESEKRLGRAVASLTVAMASSNVPKINVINGKAVGSAYLTMNSKALGADLVYAVDGSEVSTMDANAAAKIMYPDLNGAELNEKAAEYAAKQGSLAAAAGRGYIDRIVNAADVRKYVVAGFQMLLSKAESPLVKKHSAR